MATSVRQVRFTMVKRTSSRQETEGKRDLAGSQEHAVAALGYNGNEGCPFRNAGFTMECRFESAMSDAEKLPDPIVVAPAEKVKLFPLAPGVYLMKDAQGRVIYIGKA